MLRDCEKMKKTMKKTMKETDVKHYYNELASKYKSTLPDFNFREIEIESISKYIKQSDNVCDVGCGDGFSTNRFEKISKDITGIDYSHNMIKNARRSYPHITFTMHDILEPLNSLTTDENVLIHPSFDVVITERCIINIECWDKQKIAIKNIYDILEDGGVFIMMECFKDGLDVVNKARLLLNIKEDKIVDRNCFFDKDVFEKWIQKYFVIEKVQYFGLYHIISRIVHPALIYPQEPKYDSPINYIACKLSNIFPNVGDGIGHNAMYVLRKKK